MEKFKGKPFKNKGEEGIKSDFKDIKKNFRKSVAKVPVDKKKMARYIRGEPVGKEDVRVSIQKIKIAQKEKKIQETIEQAARTELLLTEDSGFLIPDEGEVTTQFTQGDIQKSVDISSAHKRFDLELNDFGPYRINYTRNGRYLLLGGRLGHVAAFDWISKKLLCEMNVMEGVYDVSWLHQETMFAVAQKKWVYFYDNQGIELHCVKKLHEVFKMMFLPYHFLLACVGNNRFLSWLDVSIGQMVEQFRIPCHGSVSTVAQSPANALIAIGQPQGIVTLWSPNNRRPVVTKWCHKQPISSIAFDPKGISFATASMDRSLKLWDARSLQGPVEEYRMNSAADNMAMSHTGVMALAMGNMIEVYKGTQPGAGKQVYLRHKLVRPVSNMEFCPFEDILGVGHSKGFCSLLVPGCGEANFDALEINPFQTKSQRKESEVKALLSKIPAELITFDPKDLQRVHTPSLQDIVDKKKNLMHIKPPRVKFELKKKTGKQKGSAKATKRKKIIKEDLRRKYYKNAKATTEDGSGESKKTVQKKPESVLDRFKNKKIVKVDKKRDK